MSVVFISFYKRYWSVLERFCSKHSFQELHCNKSNLILLIFDLHSLNGIYRLHVPQRMKHNQLREEIFHVLECRRQLLPSQNGELPWRRQWVYK